MSVIPIIGDLIGAGASILGSNISASAAKENTKAQIGWEKERATNAHQWEVEDMKKAGINPILSAGGSGAVTGNITPQMPDTSGYAKAGERIANIGQNIWSAISAKNETAQTNADIKVKDEQAKNISTDTILKAGQTGLISAQTAKTLIEKELKEKEIKWYDWKAGSEIGKNVLSPITSLLGLGTARKALRKINELPRWQPLYKN